MFWEKAPEVVPIAADSMRQSRFRLIKQFLHFSDNNALNKDDKFAKVRPLIEQLNDIFLKLSNSSPKLFWHLFWHFLENAVPLTNHTSIDRE
jgi:hypothetical protein